MRQYRIAVGVLAISSCFVTFLLYYWYRRASMSQIEPQKYLQVFLGSENKKPIPAVDGLPAQESFRVQGTPMRYVPLNEVYEDGNKNEENVDIAASNLHLTLDTTGCQIPLFYQFKFNTEKPKSTQKKPGSCGDRAVFLKKVAGDTVRAMIKQKTMKRYLRKSARFECCYRFILKSNRRGQELKKIRFTTCKKFMDGDNIRLETDFINIKCAEQRNNISHEVYDDVFAFTKKLNITNKDSKPCKFKYNVLLLGLDSMSRLRFEHFMTKSLAFFFDNYWLAYTAFNKIGDNTLPNLMAALTGHNMSSITEKCANKMEECQDLFIWTKFKELGYVTAYGEDFLRLPDTFSYDFEFKKPPTDHYIRPLFVKGEKELFNRSLVCAGKIPSGQHLLDYALDFALTYREESFFGLFWINSFSHNINNRPQDADHILENFLYRLTYTNVLRNTFVIVFSDHGIRFGDYRMKIESYYDERLPMLFAWGPTILKGLQTPYFNSFVINQFRLTTPYDLYNTLVEIHRISGCEGWNETVAGAAEGCPECQSLLSVIDHNRTCVSAAIHQKWCTCHKMFPLDVEDAEASLSVRMVISHVKNMTKKVRTSRCWQCRPLSLKNIIRLHFYFHDDKLYHVVALSMVPGNVTYEATVRRHRNKAEIVGPVSVISPYYGTKCVLGDRKGQKFCVCQRIENCR